MPRGTRTAVVVGEAIASRAAQRDSPWPSRRRGRRRWSGRGAPRPSPVLPPCADRAPPRSVHLATDGVNGTGRSWREACSEPRTPRIEARGASGLAFIVLRGAGAHAHQRRPGGRAEASLRPVTKISARHASGSTSMPPNEDTASTSRCRRARRRWGDLSTGSIAPDGVSRRQTETIFILGRFSKAAATCAGSLASS